MFYIRLNTPSRVGIMIHVMIVNWGQDVARISKEEYLILILYTRGRGGGGAGGL